MITIEKQTGVDSKGNHVELEQLLIKLHGIPIGFIAADNPNAALIHRTLPAETVRAITEQLREQTGNATLTVKTLPAPPTRKRATSRDL